MHKNRFFIATIVAILLVACKKSENTSNARTVQNLSGSYTLTSLIWTSNGVSVDVYDSLPPCEKDNTFRLDPDGSAHSIDTGVPCNPPDADSLTNWSLSPNGDSLYVGIQSVYIKSWDGKTLVYTGIVNIGPPLVTGMTTLVKQ
jgi:hypothetical protein